MSDAARPNKETYYQVLQTSLNKWTSYLTTEPKTHRLPHQAVNLESLTHQTPPFLGGDCTPDTKIPFACEETPTGNLVVNGRSTWRTSTSTSTSAGSCDLPPRVLSKQLVLGVSSRVSVELGDDAPFSDWPGVEGLERYDRGNYLAVLYLAWAYVLSARWVEMLGVSVGHECRMRYAVREEAPSEQRPMSTVEVDIGDDADEEELIWWRAVLCSTLGWDATTTYNGRDYISPWSVAAKDAGLTLTQTTRGFKPHSYSHPPGSATALEYLSRFCVYHRLYAQCSVALAGALYIPFQRGRTVYLPFPKPALRSEFKNYDDDDDGSIPDLLNQHSKLLPQYMTLSSNVWGLRSILHSTVFNIDIECNLVNAWLNPAFAAIESLSSKEYPTSHREVALAILLTNRHPRLGILWLGAILTNLARSILRDVKAGMTAVDLPASAWVGAAQTFLTAAVGTNRDSGSIPREDEYRLLFLTASEGHDRPPVWPWRPFATTGLCDTELAVRKHAGCACHGLEYESREWMLTDDNNDTNGDTTNRNSLIHQIGEKPTEIQNPAPRPISPNQTPTALDSYQRYDLSSRSLSESATRNIFGWLRSTGYPLSERDIYQHSWIDVEDTDEEESAPASDDADLNRAVQQIPTKENGHVEDWLEDVE